MESEGTCILWIPPAALLPFSKQPKFSLLRSIGPFHAILSTCCRLFCYSNHVLRVHVEARVNSRHPLWGKAVHWHHRLPQRPKEFTVRIDGYSSCKQLEFPADVYPPNEASIKCSSHCWRSLDQKGSRTTKNKFATVLWSLLLTKRENSPCLQLYKDGCCGRNSTGHTIPNFVDRQTYFKKTILDSSET